MSMCDDDSEILLLKFDNRCKCKGCPTEIRRAIVNFDGVRETRSVDYDKGIAELIVSAEVSKNPKGLCDWIQRKTKKRAFVGPTCTASSSSCTSSSSSQEESKRQPKEEIVYREQREFLVWSLLNDNIHKLKERSIFDS